MEVIEGTPDLGITSYWSDAEGNVVFGPNTPKEKMKTAFTGAKTSTPQDCEIKAVTEVKEEKSMLEMTDDAVEPQGFDLEQTEEVTEDEPLESETTDQPEEPASEEEEPGEQEAENPQ